MGSEPTGPECQKLEIPLTEWKLACTTLSSELHSL
jgi:hypothetical protein